MHETDPSLPILRLKSSLYDDYESSLTLASNVVDDASLVDLEEVFNTSLTSFPLITPSFSNTPIATRVSDSTLLASPLPLAQCMRLEMGETSRGEVSVLEKASLVCSEEPVLVTPHL